MAKKNRKQRQPKPAAVQTKTPATQTAEHEVSHVRNDLVQTVLVNLLFLILLVGLYQWNLQNGEPLNSWISSIIQI